MRIEDGDGVLQEYHPALGVTQSVDGQPVDLAVFHHFMVADDADARES